MGLAGVFVRASWIVCPGRIGAIVAALVGLIGVAIGVRSLARSSGGRVALVAGLIGIVLGGLVVATADGGVGTGNGGRRGYRGPGGGFDQRGPLWAGSCPLPMQGRSLLSNTNAFPTGRMILT